MRCLQWTSIQKTAEEHARLGAESAAVVQSLGIREERQSAMEQPEFQIDLVAGQRLVVEQMY